ncbi:AraC family transcriptional regulator [Candidatus Methanophagaceae archaeon]|nr:AraC family transcriptional regulator [Methanophagales archaeon]
MKKVGDEIDMEAEVKDMPELHVAYVRHIGPYKGDSALFGRLFEQLMGWAGPKGLLQFPETKMLSVYYDNPEITDETEMCVDVCITVPKETQVEGEVGKMTLPGGKYAVARFELAGSEEYENAWNKVFGEWLPGSGYQPTDSACYELYLNDPKEHPQGLHIVEICIPVKHV